MQFPEYSSRRVSFGTSLLQQKKWLVAEMNPLTIWQGLAAIFQSILIVISAATFFVLVFSCWCVSLYSSCSPWVGSDDCLALVCVGMRALLMVHSFTQGKGCGLRRRLGSGSPPLAGLCPACLGWLDKSRGNEFYIRDAARCCYQNIKVVIVTFQDQCLIFLNPY